MRRKDRECNAPAFFTGLLEQAEVLTLAFQTEEAPYVVPVNFVLLEGALYFHCAKEGRKLDCLKRSPGIGFSVHEVLAIDREKATTLYKSLCGTGKAACVVDMEEKSRALAALAEKYRSRCTLPIPPKVLESTEVVKISILSLSGKSNPPQADAQA
ncbi:pyridoxamine 5'-phosphate oxidase family protein [Mailhella massiliensis]|uniref:Pyridoxamine 5'-phosphate oxidase family protein n=1 Tax=Mailhella massiliensis TaxID=1903261 RepID=A0A921AXS8_9BACT|nr:pyridoxamine 5'-phosphate oxidase family protein [Mailhella massiliensis]HJD98093.1 pyridoxamine 5'-phosphate oxidase family protein [Mailhella massiliensis]